MADTSLYLDRGTFLHRLDPRAKTAATLSLFIVAVAFNHPLQAAGVACAMILLAAWARCLKNVWRVRAVLVLLVVFSLVMWPLFLRQGTPLMAVGPVTIHTESVLYGLATGIRLCAMVMAGIVFLSSTMVEEFAAGLRRLGVPFPVAFAFSTAFRMVPTVLAGSASVVQAQKSRGLDLESGNIFARLRKHLPLLVPVFVNAIRTTDLLAMALESKGFGSKRRTEYLPLRMKQWDWVALLLALGTAAAAVAARRVFGFGMVLPRL